MTTDSDDSLDRAVRRANLYIADYDRRHPEPTSAERLSAVAERLQHRAGIEPGIHPERPKLTLLRGASAVQAPLDLTRRALSQPATK